MRRALRRFRQVLGTVTLVVSSALVAAVFVVILAQIFSRYVVRDPIDGTDELARFSFVWLTFIAAAAVAATQAGHIAAEAFLRGKSNSRIPIMNLITRGVVLICCSIIAYATYGTALLSSSQVSTSLGIPMPWLYMAPTIGMLIIAIHQVLRPLRTVEVEDQEWERRG